MAKRPKRGGRVTPKGTADPRPTTTPAGTDVPRRTVGHQRELPDQVRRGGGFVARPATHHRGNR